MKALIISYNYYISFMDTFIAYISPGTKIRSVAGQRAQLNSAT